jgi:hypothetical protein
VQFNDSLDILHSFTPDAPHCLTPLVQGARGIAARFLKLSPASAFSPIMTKFSQYTPPPPATQYGIH